MMITIVEIFDILLMTAFLGFLFKDAFPVSRKPEEIISQGRDWSGFWMAAKIVAPPVILHELAHKFVALAFGLSATFHAFYANPLTLGMGILALIAKFANFGLMFIVPGYVQIQGSGTASQDFWISFAGPAVHLLFWLGATWMLRQPGDLGRNKAMILVFTQRINLFLFIFNMLPIPPFDGYHVFSSLLKMF